jgi:hypothetical protein
MPDLYSLAYISKNVIPGTPEAVKAEIRDILEAARRNNPALGVTGALLYSGGYFCQVIEGPQAVLEDLFETIQMDPRHGEVSVLHFDPIETRSFGEWAMALAGIEDAQRVDIEGIRASKDELTARSAGRDLIAVLDRLVRQHQSMLDPEN